MQPQQTTVNSPRTLLRSRPFASTPAPTPTPKMLLNIKRARDKARKRAREPAAPPPAAQQLAETHRAREEAAKKKAALEEERQQLVAHAVAQQQLRAQAAAVLQAETDPTTPPPNGDLQRVTPAAPTVTRPSARRAKPPPQRCRPVFSLSSYSDANAWTETFQQLYERHRAAIDAQRVHALDCARDARVAAAVRDGRSVALVSSDGFYRRVDAQQPYACAPQWQQLAMGTREDDDAIAIGVPGLNLVDTGGNNMILEIDPNPTLPDSFEAPWLAGAMHAGNVMRTGAPTEAPVVVLRMSRVGRVDAERDEVVAEIEAALVAGVTRVGLPLLGFATWMGRPDGTVPTFQLAMFTQKASCSLSAFLRRRSTTAADGRKLGIAVVEVLARASQLGMLMLDSKTANMLVLQAPNGQLNTFVTDTDAQFFRVLKPDDIPGEGERWPGLLLLNLLLLACHARNARPRPSGHAFLAAIRPALSELSAARAAYRSGWLYEIPASTVRFTAPTDNSVFELQRATVAICTSYFFGARASASASFAHAWDLYPEASMQTHLRARVYATAGQRCWPSDCPALVPQLLAFVKL